MKILILKAFFICASYFPLICLAQAVNFSVDHSEGCVPLTVKFTDTSTAQNITSLQWSFGNGNSSVLESPSATYTAPGSYKVVLTAKSGTSTVGTKELTITVHDKPQFDFSFSSNGGCSPLSVSFTPQDNNSLASYDWVFGDGSTSDTKNPTHVYSTAGSYSVALVGTSEFGCSSTVSKSSIIEVHEINATVSAADTILCQVPSSVGFTASASGTGSQFDYVWDFGDGGTGNGTSPVHTFQTSGVHTVAMTATDEKGCSVTKHIKIHAGNPDGIDFNISAPESCTREEVAFIAFSAREVLSMHWDFGNGETSEDLVAATTYNEGGTYQVVLTAQLAGLSCESKLIKKVKVSTNPTSDFSHTLRCGMGVAFENLSTGGSSWQWSFGDGTFSTEKVPTHVYPAPGTYLVGLTSKNADGCEVLQSRQVQVSQQIETAIFPSEPQACDGPSLAGCAPFHIAFSSETVAGEPYTLLWDFGDNSGATEANPVHIYENPGTYTVVLKATTDSGCTFAKEATVVVSSTVPKAAFSENKTEVCVNEEIKFTNNSEEADSFCWDFGDGNTATDASPSHKYSQPGLYTVTLLAKNAGCTDLVTKTELVTVKGPFVDFEVLTTCDNPYVVEFQNLSVDYDSLRWDFGDGQQSSIDSPVNEYATKGKYSVSLTASNATTGCEVVATKIIDIYHPVANFKAADTVSCKGAGIQFNDLSEDADEWFWTFGDGSVSLVKDPVKSYSNSGLFTVALTVTAPNGCSSTLQNTDMIKVLDIAGSFQFTTKNLCDTLVVNFKDLSAGFPGIQQWQWDFGDGATSAEQHPVHHYTQEGTYNVNLKLFNEEGSCAVTKKNLLSFKKPHAVFSTDADVYCLNQPLKIQNNSTNATKYLWEFGNGKGSVISSPSPIFSSPGSYTIVLTAEDADGCKSETPATKLIEVVQPQAKFTAVNTFTECPPLITTFVNESESNIVSYNWDFGDGQTSTQAQPIVTYEVPGTYTVTLHIVDKNGCTSTLAQSDVIYVGGPYGFLDFHAIESCLFEEVLFEAQSENTAIYRWDFGDGNVIETDIGTVEHAYREPGSYFVGLVFINAVGCEVPYRDNPNVVIHPLPVADFTVSQPFPFTEELLEVHLDSVKEDLSYLWFYEGQTAEGSNVTLEFAEAGEQEITVIFEDAIGCRDTVRHQLYVQQAILDLPNAFSPNSDPFNDLLVLPGVEKGRWTLQLFSRTGQKVLERTNYANNWDGSSLPAGVYYYRLSNELRPEKVLKGYLHLLK